MALSNPNDNFRTALIKPRKYGLHNRAACYAGQRHVEIISMGPVDEVAVSVSAANITALMGLPADIGPCMPEPAYAVLPGRGQYNAAVLLKSLSKGIAGSRRLRLGIINGDLCLPMLTYVFGEAQVGGKAAVISLFRLKQGCDGKKAPMAIVYERLVKIVVHEISHVLGLIHCREPGCVMSCAFDLEQLDNQSADFCPECRQVFRCVETEF